MSSDPGIGTTGLLVAEKRAGEGRDSYQLQRKDQVMTDSEFFDGLDDLLGTLPRIRRDLILWEVQPDLKRGGKGRSTPQNNRMIQDMDARKF